MSRHKMLLPAALVFFAACGKEPTAPTTQPDGLSLQAAKGPIVHKVSVGGPDVCSSPQMGLKPGCDANFSLIATLWADGSATGQWTDQYGPADGLHAVVDCVKVQEIPERFPVALEAWVGGVVTRPANQAGHRIITRMRDNGTSANDRPDALGRGIVDPEEEGYSSNCQDYPPADGGTWALPS